MAIICIVLALMAAALFFAKLNLRISYDTRREPSRGAVQLFWGERHIPLKFLKMRKRMPISLKSLYDLLPDLIIKLPPFRKALWRYARESLPIFQVEEFQGRVEWWVKDAAVTGILSGFFYTFLHLASKQSPRFQLKGCPNFEGQKFVFEGTLKIRLKLWRGISPTIRFLMQKPVREVLGLLKTKTAGR